MATVRPYSSSSQRQQHVCRAALGNLCEPVGTTASRRRTNAKVSPPDICISVASVRCSNQAVTNSAVQLQVAFVGRPNVGKSSLLNAWSGTDKAIVTQVAGTTRDIVQAGDYLLPSSSTYHA